MACPHPAAGKAETACWAPMKTIPPPTAGLDSKTGEPTNPVHSGWQDAAPQPVAAKAFSLPSSDPT